jgi:hypothetical protein
MHYPLVMRARARCTEPVPKGRNMTLAQLCCTCWALAALAELGVQGPESVLTDQLNFPAVSCIAMFPASRKRCEKVVVFGAQNLIYPEMSGCLTASFIVRKGIRLLLPICIWIGYSIVRNLDISGSERELFISFVGIFPFPKSRSQMQKPL